jgi:hypothetical protein
MHFQFIHVSKHQDTKSLFPKNQAADAEKQKEQYIELKTPFKYYAQATTKMNTFFACFK